MGFAGALAYVTVDQFVPNNAPSFVDMGATVYDEGGWWSNGNPRRLTVPPGVQRVRVFAGFTFDHNPSGVRQVVIKKNGAFITGGASPENILANARTSANLQSFTGVLSVSPGDYFESEAFQNAGGGLLLLTGSWFSIEKVEGS